MWLNGDLMVRPPNEANLTPARLAHHAPQENGARAMTLDPNLVALAAARNIGALATIKRDGRPQLSAVNFTLDPPGFPWSKAGQRCITCVATHARRFLSPAPMAGRMPCSKEWSSCHRWRLAPDDDTVEELVDVFRAIRGEDHPDWDDYRAAMVADHRLVATLHIERAYGLVRP